ncbi:Hint domain-containing protein [Pseudooceanicola onchidii]|uniref:Hint domain-containing protein n=1 Tax=Pseudooceanicola onchidii TaxID=2562279 RepID=UPI0010AAD78C|nr:Hint domain-containing protein [Pseudooceanicola onchidii]
MTNAFTKGADKALRMTEMTGAYNGGVMGACSGLVEGTKIATAMGFQRIETIEPGARVVTFDNGLQEVRAVRRDPIWFAEGACPKAMQPLFVPAGAIGNAQDMVLLPHQAVLIESDAAEAALDDPFVLMQAKDLDGICGITRITPEAPAYVVTLEFDNDEVVFAASGAMCICPSRSDLAGMLNRPEGGREYRTLKSWTDGALVDAIRAELDHGLAMAA